MPESELDKFLSKVEKAGYAFPRQGEEKFLQYARLLSGANRRLRLLSRGEERRLWNRHFLDSITPLLFNIIEPPGRLLDIGSGGGLPGIPLSIAAPHLAVTMVESAGKKARFIERALKSLNLHNAEIKSCRAEKLPAQQDYDYCTVRAVSSVPEILPIIAPHLKIGGKAIFYKGPHPEEKIISSEALLPRLNMLGPEVIELGRDLSPQGFCLVIYQRF